MTSSSFAKRSLALLVAIAVTTSMGASVRAQSWSSPRALTPAEAQVLARAASPDPAQRQLAAPELAALQTPRAEAVLVLMLQRDIDPRVRQAAATALAGTHNPELAHAARYASEADPDPGVRAAAGASYQALWPFSKRPKRAAAFSFLCPGCGHFYLRQPGKAVALLGSTLGLVAGALPFLLNNPTAERIDGTRVRLDDDDDPVAIPLLIGAQNLWWYGIFAAYRDARLMRNDVGYKFPVAKEGLAELAFSPFNPRVLKKPWVWAGLPLMVGAAAGFTYLLDPDGFGGGMRSLSDGGGVDFLGKHYSTRTGFALGELYYASLFLPVGVGEEALFRGVIQAGLMETSLGMWGGWAVASAIFGGVHVTNFIGAGGPGVGVAAVAVPYLIVTGSYLGLVYMKTGFSLEASAALHFWYDFALGTISFIADPDNQPFTARYGFRF
jgi:hypothetical protein